MYGLESLSVPAITKQWIDNQKDTFRMVPPQASAIAFVRYQLDVNSTELANKLIKEKCSHLSEFS